jgi:hypothetical protein
MVEGGRNPSTHLNWRDHVFFAHRPCAIGESRKSSNSKTIESENTVDNTTDMAALTINVPAGDKQSEAFKDALKVALAVTTYSSKVEWVKGTEPLTG